MNIKYLPSSLDPADIKEKCEEITNSAFKRKMFSLITNNSVQGYPSTVKVYYNEANGLVVIAVKFEHSLFYFFHDIDWRVQKEQENDVPTIKPFIAFMTDDKKHKYYIEHLDATNEEFSKWREKIDALVIKLIKEHYDGINFLKLL